jgi:hypothetical protein
VNTLTVNVLKCEVIAFGARRASLTFRYRGEPIPVRSSVKYLGVWIDCDLSGKALADAMFAKFTAAVPVFFSLCRRLKIARLDLVFRLAEALVFSLLYGCEFLRRADVVVRCEEAWWRGVRSFFGLPSGVSTVFLHLIFPRFSLVHKVLSAKLGLLLRGTQPLATLFPEAIVFDRGCLFSKHRKGYSQMVRDWCEQLGVLDLFFCGGACRG